MTHSEKIRRLCAAGRGATRTPADTSGLEGAMHLPEEADQALKHVPPEWMAGEQDEFERMLELQNID